MAVVRITEELKSDVLNAVSKQFDKAEESAKRLRPEIGMDVYNIVLKQFLIDIKNVPEEYFNTTEKLYVRVKGLSAGDVYENWGLDEPLPVPYALPEDQGSWGTGSYGGITIELHRDPEFATVYEQVDAWQDALAKVKDDRAAAKHAVKKILDGFTTLAPALKAWPALWDLLSEHYKDKHREIVEKKKPAPAVDVNMDSLTGLTAKLVAQRIAAKKEG